METSLLTRHVQLTWNGRTVLMGACTAAAAYSVAVQHMEQFAGRDWHAWYVENIARARLLDRIVARERVVLTYADETGEASALIEAL